GIDPSLRCSACRYSSAREAGSSCPCAPVAPATTAASRATAPSAIAPATPLRDRSIPHSSRGSRLHLAGGSPPHEAYLPSRAGVEWRLGSVSWLADLRHTAAFPRDAVSHWHAGPGSPFTVARQRRTPTAAPSPRGFSARGLGSAH